MEWIQAIKDIVLSLAAIVTAWSAYHGIKKWRDELTGKAEFEVARELAKATYKLRDCIHGCRSPLLRSDEFPPEYNMLKDNEPEDKGKAYAHLYSKRWKSVSEAFIAYEVAALESEALWGSDIKDATERLKKLVVRLRVAIEAVIANEYSGNEHFEDQNYRKQMNSVVSSTDEENNEFSKNITLCIEQLETILRPHLSRS